MPAHATSATPPERSGPGCWPHGLKTLAAAAVPVLLGCALACAADAFRPGAALLCFAFAFLMQIDANLINDLGDYLKGADRADRIGPERACARGWITPAPCGAASPSRPSRPRRAAAACSATAVRSCWPWASPACSSPFSTQRGLAPRLPRMGRRTGAGLLRLHTRGRHLLRADRHGAPAVAPTALAAGLVIDTLLLLNNYRDREQDALSGKRTLVVRLGARAGERLYLAAGCGAAALCLTLWPLSPPPHCCRSPTCRCTWQRGAAWFASAAAAELNRLLGTTSRNILLFGLLLALGIALARC